MRHNLRSGGFPMTFVSILKGVAGGHRISVLSSCVPIPLNSPWCLALMSVESVDSDGICDDCDEGAISEGQLDFFASLLGKWQICEIGVRKKEDPVKQSCLRLDDRDKQSRGDKKS